MIRPAPGNGKSLRFPFHWELRYYLTSVNFLVYSNYAIGKCTLSYYSTSCPYTMWAWRDLARRVLHFVPAAGGEYPNLVALSTPRPLTVSSPVAVWHRLRLYMS